MKDCHLAIAIKKMHITFCPSNFILGIPAYVENDKYSRALPQHCF